MIELLYEIRTHLLGNHDYRIRRDLRQQSSFAFHMHLGFSMGQSANEQNSQSGGKGT